MREYHIVVNQVVHESNMYSVHAESAEDARQKYEEQGGEWVKEHYFEYICNEIASIEEVK